MSDLVIILMAGFVALFILSLRAFLKERDTSEGRHETEKMLSKTSKPVSGLKIKPSEGKKTFGHSSKHEEKIAAEAPALTTSVEEDYAKEHGMKVCPYCETFNQMDAVNCVACGARWEKVG